MIARLTGKVLEKHPNRVIVDVAGVGYDVQVPLSTYYVAGDVGSEMALRVHTHVREDQLALYGFATELELTMFEKLIVVSGIGPKLALSVLSGIEPRELAGAIQRSDLARLTAIPGVARRPPSGFASSCAIACRRPSTRRRRRRAIRCAKIWSRRSPISATIGRRSTRCSTS